MSTIMEQKVCFLEQKKRLPDLWGGFKMRIAICEPDKAFATTLKSEIYRYAEKNRIEIMADCFSYGEVLLKNENQYNLIFMGYYLGGINGLKTAEGLRKSGNNTPIIFISDYTDFIFDSFKVKPYGFILKSDLSRKLFTTLNDFFSKMGENYPLWVKSNEDTVCISTEDIYYLEADNKHCYIHLRNETLHCHKTMAQVFSVLPKNHFSKTNRAFIVNLNHIRRYNNDIITLKNGKTLHPSRTYYKAFKEEYRRFLRPLEI